MIQDNRPRHPDGTPKTIEEMLRDAPPYVPTQKDIEWAKRADDVTKAIVARLVEYFEARKKEGST